MCAQLKAIYPNSIENYENILKDFTLFYNVFHILMSYLKHDLIDREYFTKIKTNMFN